MSGFAGVYALWWREMARFLRQRSRVIGACVQPLLFWVLLGSGFGLSFRPAGTPADVDAMQYFYPGILVLVLLFTAIFSTIAVVEDRRSGFLQGVMIAPISRSRVVLGQALGGTTLAVGQGALLLALAPLAGVSLSVASVVATVAMLAAVGFALTSLGLVIAWRMESTQGFHAIMNLILMPIWLLSGAFFPAAGAAGWLGWVMYLNPLTYGMGAVRRCLYLDMPSAVGAVPPLVPSVVVTVVFGIVAFVGATIIARRSA